MSDWASMCEAADRLVSDLGAPDVVVANAGIGGPIEAFEDHTLEEWDEVIAVNLTGAFLTCKVARGRIEEVAGAVLWLASTAAAMLTGVATTTAP